jgi:hypothetical protein
VSNLTSSSIYSLTAIVVSRMGKSYLSLLPPLHIADQ